MGCETERKAPTLPTLLPGSRFRIDAPTPPGLILAPDLLLYLLFFLLCPGCSLPYGLLLTHTHPLHPQHSGRPGASVENLLLLAWP